MIFLIMWYEPCLYAADSPLSHHCATLHALIVPCSVILNIRDASSITCVFRNHRPTFPVPAQEGIWEWLVQLDCQCPWWVDTGYVIMLHPWLLPSSRRAAGRPGGSLSCSPRRDLVSSWWNTKEVCACVCVVGLLNAKYRVQAVNI